MSARGRRRGQGGWLVLSMALALSGGLLLAAGGLRWLQPEAGLSEPGHVLSLRQQQRVGRALAAYAVQRLAVAATDDDPDALDATQTDPPLPCPADPTAAAARRYGRLDDAGLESRTNGLCTVQVGLLPWQTLGLQRRDAFDRFGQPLTYAVTPAAANTPSVTETRFCGSATGPPDFAADPARLIISPTGEGTAATSASDVPLVALISHGQDRQGAYNALRARPARTNEGNDAQRAQERNHDEADSDEQARQLAAASVNLDRNGAYFDDLVWFANGRGLLRLVRADACP